MVHGGFVTDTVSSGGWKGGVSPRAHQPRRAWPWVTLPAGSSGGVRWTIPVSGVLGCAFRPLPPQGLCTYLCAPASSDASARVAGSVPAVPL